MKLLRIKDNTPRSKDDFSDVSKLTSKIADKTLEQLDREGLFVFPATLEESEDIDDDQMILRSKNDCYWSGNVMGYLGYGDERLIIQSRFGDDDNDFFLQYMLHKVLEFPNLVNLETDADLNNRLFNLLLFLFPLYLRSAMRKGLYKIYIRREYNDDSVRGTIDIARHILKNTPFMGKIAYSQREFSYNNYLTELIRHTIEYIKKRPFGNTILLKVKDEVKLIIEATPDYKLQDRRRIINDNLNSMVRHAYYKEYMALQQLCLLILQNQMHQIGSGARKVYGILFDGSWLWEEYINLLIGNEFYHPNNRTGEGVQQLFAGEKRKKGRIYPDFISHDTEARIIADAKYKPINNIGRDDYLQVLAYMFRFDAKNGLYLYPEAGDDDDSHLWLNKGSTFENNVSARDDICLTKHGLKIPCTAENYEQFVLKMQESEEAFKTFFQQ